MNQPILTFSGTRNGMTESQLRACENILKALQPARVRHGGCHGADREFHVIARDYPRYIHPGDRGQQLWAVKEGFLVPTRDFVFEPTENHIQRDKLMIDLSTHVLATPKGVVEQMRGSGTWVSIRYAKKLKRPLFVVWPDGVVSDWNL